MKIAVYCGSSFGYGDVWRDAAKRLGSWIGSNGHTLVYGGGEAGLMGVVAEACKKSGGYVIGVLPMNVPFICNRPQPFCDEVIKAENMAVRKQTMLDLADAFVALPGGFGTIDEITEAITLTRIGVFNKKAVFMNPEDYYAPMKAMIAQMTKAGFVEENGFPFALFTDSTDEIEAFLKA